MLAERDVAHNWTKVLGVADKLQRGLALTNRTGSRATGTHGNFQRLNLPNPVTYMFATRSHYPHDEQSQRTSRNQRGKLMRGSVPATRRAIFGRCFSNTRTEMSTVPSVTNSGGAWRGAYKMYTKTGSAVAAASDPTEE